MELSHETWFSWGPHFAKCGLKCQYAWLLEAQRKKIKKDVHAQDYERKAGSERECPTTHKSTDSTANCSNAEARMGDSTAAEGFLFSSDLKDRSVQFSSVT